MNQETAALERNVSFCDHPKMRDQKELESFGMALDTHSEAKDLLQEITENLSIT